MKTIVKIFDWFTGRMILAAIFYLLLSLIAAKAFGQTANELQEKPEWNFDSYRYVQIRYNDESGFHLSHTVFSFGLNYDKWNLKLEINPASKDEEKARDAWAQFSPWSWLKIRAGRQFMFYTIGPSPKDWWLVEYPGVEDVLNLATIYDTGLVTEIEQGFFHTYIGLINGSGKEFEDDNKSKDFYFHQIVGPSGFKLGIVYQKGKQPQGNRTRYGGSVELELWKLHFMAEYFSQTSSYELKKDGWYVIGIFKLNEHLQLIGQYDTYMNSTDEKQLFTAGLILYPVDFVKFKLNITTDKKALMCLQFSF